MEFTPENRCNILGTSVDTNLDTGFGAKPRSHRGARPVLFVAFFLFSSLNILAQSTPSVSNLHGQVTDETDQPVARVEIIFHFGGHDSETIYTDAAGHFQLAGINATQITATFSKPGFFQINNRVIDLSTGENELSLILNHETVIQEKLDVESAPIQIDPDTTSHQESVVQHEIQNVPVAASHDLQQSLRVVPSVVADVNGKLHVAGARQGQTQVLLDGFEINNPANGSFDSRVDVDAVQEVLIETGGFGAQYSHAGGGIVSIATQSGDDKLRFGITNFIPGISFESGTHFGNWYPRVTLSGPLKKGKIWFSDALTIQHTISVVKELPGGQNLDSQWVGDNLIRVQANLTSRNTLQGSFLYNQLNDPRAGLGPFSPLSTTTNNQSKRYFVSVKDQILMGRTLFDVGVAADTGHNASTPIGSSTYIVTPSATSGNYFQTLSQDSRRLQFIGNITSGALNWLGKHTLSAGWNAAGLEFSQRAARSEIDFLRNDGTLSERATFSGPDSLRISNTQIGGYVQDLWRPFKPVVFSFGMRGDWDRIIDKHIFEPRLAMNWVPADDGRMKFTLAWGEHYTPLILSTLAMGLDQQRSDVFFDPTGLIPLGPPTVSAFVLDLSRLEQPRSYNTTAEWDARVFASTFVGTSFLLRESRDGLVWITQPSDALLLESTRNDRYIAGEAWIRHAFSEKAEATIDYTRSSARSNEVLDPTLASLILSPQEPGPLLWDAPNRVIASGWTPIPIWGLFLSSLVEYRTGFPFSVINEQQQLAAPANSLRFPDYFSLNLGLEKQFPFKGHEWAVRVSAINLTGHNNPDSVVNDIDAPNFLTYAGGQRRAFTFRLRLVTQH
jgi:hypothetical protein